MIRMSPAMVPASQIVNNRMMSQGERVEVLRRRQNIQDDANSYSSDKKKTWLKDFIKVSLVRCRTFKLTFHKHN